MQNHRKTTNKGIHCRIRNSLGVYQAMEWYRKNKPQGKEYVLSPSQFYKIIRETNNAVARRFLQTGEFMFPLGLGKLIVTETHPKTCFKDGTLVTSLPVDWDTTFKLWDEDPQSLKEKRLVRFVTDRVCRITYRRDRATYRNRTYFDFKPNTIMKRALKNSLNEGKFTTYEQYKMIN